MKLPDAVYALYPNIKSMVGNDAFDADGNQVQYDKALAETKLAELEAQIISNQQAQESARASALVKLSALGLTADEIKAITS
jgi:roadblock/LC7 domain-containing protein